MRAVRALGAALPDARRRLAARSEAGRTLVRALRARRPTRPARPAGPTRRGAARRGRRWTSPVLAPPDEAARGCRGGLELQGRAGGDLPGSCGTSRAPSTTPRGQGRDARAHRAGRFSARAYRSCPSCASLLSARLDRRGVRRLVTTPLGLAIVGVGRALNVAGALAIRGPSLARGTAERRAPAVFARPRRAARVARDRSPDLRAHAGLQQRILRASLRSPGLPTSALLGIGRSRRSSLTLACGALAALVGADRARRGGGARRRSGRDRIAIERRVARRTRPARRTASRRGRPSRRRSRRVADRAGRAVAPRAPRLHGGGALAANGSRGAAFGLLEAESGPDLRTRWSGGLRSRGETSSGRAVAEQLAADRRSVQRDLLLHSARERAGAAAPKIALVIGLLLVPAALSLVLGAELLSALAAARASVARYGLAVS